MKIVVITLFPELVGAGEKSDQVADRGHAEPLEEDGAEGPDARDQTDRVAGAEPAAIRQPSRPR